MHEQLESPADTGTETTNGPEWGRDEMSLFFGVLGLALSELAVFQAWHIWVRIGAAIGTTVIAIPLISAIAPRVNRLVSFLTSPHSLGEYGKVFGTAWRARTKGNRSIRRIVTGVLVLAIALGWLVVLPRQNRIVEEKLAIAASQGLAGEAELIRDSRPDLALLLAIEARRLYPTNEARGSLLTGLANRLESYFLPAQGANAVAASPDGSLIVSGHESGALSFWDTTTHQRTPVPNAHTGSVHAVAFSRDGRVASAGVDGVIRLHDPSTGARLPTSDQLTRPAGEIWDLSFDRTGRLLVSAGEDGLRVWDFDENRQRFNDSSARAFVVDLNSKGSHAVVGGEGKVNVRGLETIAPGNRIDLLGQVEVAAFIPGTDNQVVAAGADGQLWRWDPGSGEKTAFGRHDGVRFIATHEASGLVATSGGDTVIIWDLSDRQPRRHREILPPGEPGALTFVGEQDLAVSTGSTIAVYSLAARSFASSLGDAGPGWAVDVDDDGLTAATGHAGGEVVLWDIVSGESRRLGTSEVHGDTVGAVALTADGRHVISADIEGGLGHWRIAEDGSPELAWSTVADTGIRGLAIDKHGDVLISGHRDGTIMVWRITDDGLELRDTFAAGPEIGDGLWAIAYDPHHNRIAAGGDSGVVMTLDAGSGQLITRSQDRHQDRIEQLVFTSDGTHLVSVGDDMAVSLWEADQLERADSHAGFNSKLWSVAMSADDRMIIVGEGAQISFLALAENEEAGGFSLIRFGKPLAAHRDTVQGIAFVPPFGMITVSPNAERPAFLWDFSFERLAQRACAVANRNLTQAEWDEAHPDGKDYVRHCPDLPSGDGAPDDAPAAEYKWEEDGR